MSLLINTVKQNDTKQATSLLLAGHNVDEVDGFNNTPLMIAASNGNLMLVQTLLNYDADVNHQNNIGETPIMWAIVSLNNEEPRTDIITLLIEAGADVNLASITGDTPLIISSKTGDLAIVSLLVNAGANVNAANTKMQTALMNAAVVADAPDVARFLLAKGAVVNAVDNEGESALFWIFVGDSTEDIDVMVMAEVLLEHGATVDLKNENGTTPLMKAASANLVDTMRALVVYGADPNTTDAANETSLFYAVSENSVDACQYLLSLPNVDVDFGNGVDQTCLMLASSRDYTDTMRVLLENGASVFNQDHDGWTPLIFAANAGLVDACKLLLDTDIRCLDLTDTSGSTALYYAIKANSVECVMLLLGYGADPLVEDEDSQTPLETVTDGTDDTISDLLLTAEATALRKASSTLALKLGAVRTAVKQGMAPKAPRLMQRVVQQSEYDRLCNPAYIGRMKKAEMQALARSYDIPISGKTKATLCQDIAQKLKQIR